MEYITKNIRNCINFRILQDKTDNKLTNGNSYSDCATPSQARIGPPPQEGPTIAPQIR